jgi:uncharacterized protein
MSFSTVIILLIIGLLAGLVGGGLGVGGGIVVLPALIFFLGFSQHQAQGTSMVMMLPPITILAAYNYYKQGFVNMNAAIILMVAFVVGSYFGSLLAMKIPDKTLTRIFGFLLLFVAIKLIWGK